MSTCVCVLSNNGERLMRLESKTYITSGCHNKGTRLLIPANGKSKSVAISKVQVVCHAGAWIQII